MAFEAWLNLHGTKRFGGAVDLTLEYHRAPRPEWAGRLDLSTPRTRTSTDYNGLRTPGSTAARTSECANRAQRGASFGRETPLNPQEAGSGEGTRTPDTRIMIPLL